MRIAAESFKLFSIINLIEHFNINIRWKIFHPLKYDDKKSGNYLSREFKLDHPPIIPVRCQTEIH